MKRIIVSALVLACGLLLVPESSEAQKLSAQIYELRVYHTHPGKLDNLHARFKEHTNHLFVKHGMQLIAYWVPADEDNKLIYVLSFPSIEAREKSWAAFAEDAEWKAARDASHENAGGPIVDKIESTIMFPTEYSPIR